jgi:hypothetical protein
MGFSIRWEERSVRVDYYGRINNQEIEKAHFSLNGDARFYDCKSLILDISRCNMDEVLVDGLINVVATDLGASETLRYLKVAMIAVCADNIAKASRYIEWCRSCGYPWQFELFASEIVAREWLEA